MSYSSKPCAALSFRPDFQISLQQTWNTDIIIIFFVPVVHRILRSGTLVLKIQNRKSTRRISSDIFDRWPCSQNMKAACQQREYKMSLWASGSIRSICGSSTSQNLRISYIPSEVAGGIYSSSWNLGSPSLSLPDQTEPRSFSHICFQVLSRLFVPQTREQVWALKVPQREVNGEKRQRGHWSGCVTRRSLP